MSMAECSKIPRGGMSIFEKPLRIFIKKPDEAVLGPDCITDFLGDVAENETVQNAKLNNTEKDTLDRNLTIEELDQSIKQAKTQSALGADGFSNKFIQEFWDIYQVPLFKMIVKCYDNNKLKKHI